MSTTTGHDLLLQEVGISYRQLNYWVAKGLLPDARSTGTGVSMSFTPADRKRLHTLAALSRLGMVCSQMAACAPRLEAGETLRLGPLTIQYELE